MLKHMAMLSENNNTLISHLTVKSALLERSFLAEKPISTPADASLQFANQPRQQQQQQQQVSNFMLQQHC
ncbi:unnamed protein product [Ceratitis capitata]|uniref:(Mediterranean fruit fly) hypothetical protein n=1 Tax=Ceratitis capitata TaxID=7213 RepID=A0A811U9A0_CERCA|nr:unnamed protein product [Ceratitis capitata]